MNWPKDSASTLSWGFSSSWPPLDRWQETPSFTWGRIRPNDFPRPFSPVVLRFHDVIAVSLFEFFRKTCRQILKYWCNGIRVWVYFHVLLDSQTIPLNLCIFFKLCPSPKNLFTFFIFQSLIYSTLFTVFAAVVQLLSHIQLFMAPWTAAHQASLSLTISQSHPNSCPSNRWCCPTIPSAVTVLSYFTMPLAHSELRGSSDFAGKGLKRPSWRSFVYDDTILWKDCWFVVYRKHLD